MADQLLNDRQRLDWLRLINSENIGPVTFRQLINRYGSASESLKALPELSRRGGLMRPLRIYPRERAEQDMANAEHYGARFVALGEADYPVLLQHIDQAPPIICVKGDPSLAVSRPVAAIVGARNASAIGRRFCRDLASALAAAGYVIASGLARGIDTAAHESTLATGTIGVLAGGIDVVYPPENSELHEQIGASGLLISEMVPGTRPRGEYFPRRNRIVSGISLCVIVVEAAKRSGSLITARLAGEQGREVFAVPGSPLDPRAAGANKLLREGAHLVTSAQDILDVLNSMAGPPSAPDLGQDDMEYHGETMETEPDEDVQAVIISLLGPMPVTVDDLIRESGCPSGAVLTVLLELELAGRLVRHAGHGVSLV